MANSRVTNIIDIFKNIMMKTKSLNDNDFEKVLCNIELIKKDIIQLRKRSKSTLIEKVDFRDFLKR